MATRQPRSPVPRVAREDSASLVAWSMICKLDVIRSGRSRLDKLGVGHSSVTEDLAWADDPDDPAPRRRSIYLHQSHADAVESLYRIAPAKMAPPNRWIKAELLSLAPISVVDLLLELSLRLPPVPWPFTWWRQLNSTDPGTRESVLIRTSLLADELEKAAILDERGYNLDLMHRNEERVSDLVDRLLTIASGPPLSARPAIRVLGRLCCHSPAAWERIQQHISSHPLGHRAHLAFTRMLRQPRTPRERAMEITIWLLDSPTERLAHGRAPLERRCWNIQGLSAEAVGLLPTTQPVTEQQARRVDTTRRPKRQISAESDIDYTGAVLPSGLWSPDELEDAEALLRHRTAAIVARLRELARNRAARRGVSDEPPPDLVSERLALTAMNIQYSWRIRALAADGFRTHRQSSLTIVSEQPQPDSDGGSSLHRVTGGVARRLDRTYQGSMSELLTQFAADVSAGFDPSGGLSHAVAVFRALESSELSRPGRRPTPAPVDDSGHVPDDQPLRRSPAIGEFLQEILDDVIPERITSSHQDAEDRHRAAFTEALHHVVDGLDPWFDLEGDHAVPRAARRGVRVLIRTMLGSLDIGRERRAASTLVAAGMAVPTMCVLNRLLRADLDGTVADHGASFLTQQALLYLGYLAENPLAGIVILRWLDRRWPEWREELRQTPLLEPTMDPASAESRLWPTGDELAAYLRSRHKLELMHTAVWALGDVKWDALAHDDARAWLREKWKLGVVMLYDIATYGLIPSDNGYNEPTVENVPSALLALREAAYYALAVTRWDEAQPTDPPTQRERIPVTGNVRRWYSHDRGEMVAHAHQLPQDALSPADVARDAVEAVDKVTINGMRPGVLEGLRTWRKAYRTLVYPGKHQ
jgi:hypothetical protein